VEWIVSLVLNMVVNDPGFLGALLYGKEFC
jgi:hypothetical protein